MSNFRVTMHFGYLKWGFDEEHYWIGNNLELRDCEKDAALLVMYRKLLLQADGPQVEAVTLTQCDDKGNTFLNGVSKIVYPRGQGKQGVTNSDCTSPWLTVYMRLYDVQAAYARNHYLRGFGDANNCGLGTVFGPPFNPSPKNIPYLRNYVAFLCSSRAAGNNLIHNQVGGLPLGPDDPLNAPFSLIAALPTGRWGMRASNKATGRQKSFKIIDADEDTKGIWSVRLPAGTGIVKGDKVHIHGGVGESIENYNGTWRVLSGPDTVDTVPNWYTLSGPDPHPDCLAKFTDFGVIWKVTTTLIPYASAELARIVRRATGKVKFGTKGRSRKGCKKPLPLP